MRKDDHSYTYIHNFNAPVDSAGSKKVNIKSEPNEMEYPMANEAPFYNKGMNRQSSNNTDQDYLQYKQLDTEQPKNITHNHYYASNTQERPRYNPPQNYAGFNPSVRRFLLEGESR